MDVETHKKASRLMKCIASHKEELADIADGLKDFGLLYSKNHVKVSDLLAQLLQEELTELEKELAAL